MAEVKLFLLAFVAVACLLPLMLKRSSSRNLDHSGAIADDKTRAGMPLPPVNLQIYIKIIRYMIDRLLQRRIEREGGKFYAYISICVYRDTLDILLQV